jgi:hypothetical protein
VNTSPTLTIRMLFNTLVGSCLRTHSLQLNAADVTVALVCSVSEVTSSQHAARLLTPNPVLPELRAQTLERPLGEKTTMWEVLPQM